MKYAEILSSRVRHIGEAPQLPEFQPPLFAVDLTGIFPVPKEGWIYKNETFTEAKKLIQPPPPESLESKMDRILDRLATLARIP